VSRARRERALSSKSSSTYNVMKSCKFILIDDDSLSNLISRHIIERIAGKVDIEIFGNGQSGILYIESHYSAENLPRTKIFLDINMPVMSGWEFLDRFDQLSPIIKGCIEIYVLTSSLHWRDKERSAENKNVKDHLAKPLTPEFIKILTQEN
jgi:CheY-like chemotaxis protein